MMSALRRRRFQPRFAALLAAATALAIGGCGQTPSDSPSEDTGDLTTVKVGLAVPTFNTALINLVIDEDMDADNGLDMQTTRSGAGSTNQIAAMRSGEYDFAGVGTATVVDANAEGADLVIVGGTGGLINNLVLNAETAESLDVDADDPVEDRIKALRGMTIATSPPGSTSNSTLRYLVSQQGLDPERDLDIVPVNDPSALVAGIRQGKFDGSFFGVGIADANIADGSGQLWLSLPRGDIEEFTDLVGVCIVTTREYAEKNPDAVEAFHASLAQAQQFVAEEPDAAGEALRANAFADLEEDVFDSAWEQARTGYPAGAVFTRANWDTYVDLFQSSTDKDLSAISYEDLVAEPARGDS